VPSCPRTNDFSGKASDLQWSVYTVKDSDSEECIPYVNVTWRLPQDGKFRFVTVLRSGGRLINNRMVIFPGSDVC